MKKLSKKEWIAVGVGVIFITYMFFGNTVISTFDDVTNNQSAALNTATGPAVIAKDLKIGTGLAVEKGMQVSINYMLKLADGTVIHDSKLLNNGIPFNFLVGGGQLNSNWESGILGMRVGGKRMITIPPELGYGARQVGPIPPNSTLIFEIEIVSATPSLQ